MLLTLADDAVAAVVLELIQGMLGIEGVLHVEAGLPAPSWRTASIAIRGDHGLVAVSADPRSCCLLTAAMLSREPEYDPVLIDEVLCELANIIAGQIATLMAIDDDLDRPEIVDTHRYLSDAREPSWRSRRFRIEPIQLAVLLTRPGGDPCCGS
jgi:hypothetical protein